MKVKEDEDSIFKEIFNEHIDSALKSDVFIETVCQRHEQCFEREQIQMSHLLEVVCLLYIDCIVVVFRSDMKYILVELST